MTSIGSLYTSLTLQSASFISGLNQAAQATTRASQSINSALGTAKAAASGFIAAFGVQQVAQLSKNALDYADAIADLSDRTGASTKFIQEFRYAAQLSGSSVESADAAIEKFTKTLGQAQSGSKAQAKLFADLGVTATDLEGAARQTIEGISKLDTVQQKNAKSMQFFGKSAADLTVLLGGGVLAYDNLARAANDLGVVLADDVARGAGEANDKLDQMSMILSAQLANAVVTNASAIVSLATGITGLATSLAQFWAQNPGQANALMAGIAAGLLTPGPAPIKLGAALLGGAYAYGTSEKSPEQLDSLIGSIDKQRGQFRWDEKSGKPKPKALADMDKRRAELVKKRDDALRKKREAFIGQFINAPIANPSAGALPTGETAKLKTAKAAKVERDAGKEMLEKLKFETEQLGRSAIEQEVYNNLKGLGAEQEAKYGKAIAAATVALEFRKLAVDELADANTVLDDAQKGAAESLLATGNDAIASVYETNAAALGKWSDAQEALTRRLEYFADDVGASVGDAFEDMIFSGASLGDTLKNLAADFAYLVVRMSVIEPMARSVSNAISNIGSNGGGGGGGGILGSILKFGGKLFAASSGASLDADIDAALAASIDGARALGGPVSGGSTYLVGENGPELFKAPMSGVIVPNSALRGGGAPIINIDARGSTDPAMVRQQVELGIAAYMPTIVANASAHTSVRLGRPRIG